MKKINKKFQDRTVKITDIEFDEILGHNTCNRVYFNIENNNKIYKRLKEETNIQYLPYLGPCVDYGSGDICLEETIEDSIEIFKFYVIDRMAKYDLSFSYNIIDAIEKLVSYYEKNGLINDSNKMKNIFYESLNIEKPLLKIIK